jgi:hypothetical protein
MGLVVELYSVDLLYYSIPSIGSGAAKAMLIMMAKGESEW